jgi:hydrogenase maturation protease
VKTLVLGIGNDILGDDGVGIHIARSVARRVKRQKIVGVNVEETGAAGLSLLERIKGYQRLIIADALLTDNTDVGKIHRLTLKDLKTSDSITPHDAALRTTLEIGNNLFPGEMPADIVIFAVQTHNVEIVTGEMTPAVKAAVPKVVRMIMAEIKG